VILDGRSHLVDLDPRGGGTLASTALTDAIAKVEDARTRKLARAAGRGGVGPSTGEELRAPIAGKMVKLLVEVGAVVTAGQGVVVLEAMKMENEFRATGAGVVSAIHVTPGQAVSAGDLLLVVD